MKLIKVDHGHIELDTLVWNKSLVSAILGNKTDTGRDILSDVTGNRFSPIQKRSGGLGINAKDAAQHFGTTRSYQSRNSENFSCMDVKGQLSESTVSRKVAH